MFLPKAIYYEKEIENYELGKELLNRYRKQDISMYIIENHNNIEQMRSKENLSEKVKKDAFFELIFMTYSYVHKMINREAFPNSINLYAQEKMTGRGKGKYMYRKEIRQEAEKFFLETMKQYFPNNKIIYIV